MKSENEISDEVRRITEKADQTTKMFNQLLDCRFNNNLTDEERNTKLEEVIEFLQSNVPDAFI